MVLFVIDILQNVCDELSVELKGNRSFELIDLFRVSDYCILLAEMKEKHVR